MRRTTDILNDSPCKGCKERYEAYHGKCERYKAFADEFAESSAEKNKEKYSHNILGTSSVRSKRFRNGKNCRYLERKKIRDES